MEKSTNGQNGATTLQIKMTPKQFPGVNELHFCEATTGEYLGSIVIRAPNAPVLHAMLGGAAKWAFEAASAVVATAPPALLDQLEKELERHK